MTALPTKRLTLRHPLLSDDSVYTAFFTPEGLARGSYRGRRRPSEAKTMLTEDIVHWTLYRHGCFMLLHDDATIGLASITIPHRQTRPELTWCIASARCRQSFAAEASRALFLWACDTLGWLRLKSRTRPGNDAAHALLTHLGERYEGREMIEDHVGRDAFAFDLEALA